MEDITPEKQVVELKKQLEKSEAGRKKLRDHLVSARAQNVRSSYYLEHKQILLMCQVTQPAYTWHVPLLPASLHTIIVSPSAIQRLVTSH